MSDDRYWQALLEARDAAKAGGHIIDWQILDRMVRAYDKDPGVLDIERPYTCQCGKDQAGIEACAACQANDPPAAHLVIQDGKLFGWSESNVRYECLDAVEEKAGAPPAAESDVAFYEERIGGADDLFDDMLVVGRLVPMPGEGKAERGRWMPRRIQRKREKGWRMPGGAVYVGRPTKWGNPFIVGREIVRERMEPGGGMKAIIVVDAAHAVALYRRFLSLRLRISARIELAGKDLACWCPPGAPCHADVLLELANR